MKIPALTPRIGKDTLSVGNNEKLVVNEHFGKLPKGPVQSVKYGIYFICTSGQAELDYAGQRLEIHKGDLFLYCAYNIMDNIQTSADFDCREIWFTREAMWDINMLSKKSLYDIVSLIRYPKVTLSKDEKSLLDDYYKLLCHRMRDDAKMMQDDIVQTIFSALALEILCIVRRGYEKIIQAQNEGDGNTLCINTLRGKQLADRYIKLVEDSDGRIRRVEEFARMLNVTPTYLTRQLKDAINRTPSEIISLFSAKAIEYRLRFTDMTMQQIADDLQFANASFFGRYAKQHLGMTPLEYRSRYQNKKNKM